MYSSTPTCAMTCTLCSAITERYNVESLSQTMRAQTVLEVLMGVYLMMKELREALGEVGHLSGEVHCKENFKRP